MTQLSLSVASNDLPIIDQWRVVASLLLASELQDGLGEHLHVESHGVRASKHEIPAEVLALLV